MTSPDRISLPARVESLKDIRKFLKDACSLHPRLTGAVLYDIQLAVDEACTNIITHGYAGLVPGSILLDVEPSEDRVVVRITDFGRAFEPSQAKAPAVNVPLQERKPGGFGIYFIYQSMDEVRYDVVHDRNVMTLTKYLPVTPVPGRP